MAHRSVMLGEVLAQLAPAAEEIYLDGTFGAGGYSRGILESAACRVVAMDRDTSVAPFAEALRQAYPERFAFLPGRFGDMLALLAERGIDKLHGIVLDIGVSSMQIDQAERGFSFQSDGPLDMRMGGEGISAADVVNGYGEAELADILYHYGEEKASRRIAKAIVAARAEAPITRTRELSRLVASVIGRQKDGKDPATRTFQALRIHVNDELTELEQALEAAERLLHPGGRLVVVVFHSLEDRIVKRFLTERGKAAPAGSRHLPMTREAASAPTFSIVTKRALGPGDAEASANPRARSAKLRAAIRTPRTQPEGGCLTCDSIRFSDWFSLWAARSGFIR